MNRILLTFLATATFVAACFGAEPIEKDKITPREWSIRMAESELSRQGNALEWREGGKGRWDYTSGLFALSLMRLGEETKRPDLAEAGARIVTSPIQPDGSIRTYKFEDFNIDNVTPARALLWWNERHPQESYLKALQLIRRQLKEHPRTSEGGFWHKLRYPHQMWLDGLYMGSPFYMRYGTVFGEAAAYDDVAKQILLIDKHLYDAKTGLYFHGWDEERLQAWANKETGLSPSFWSRAIGWYAMAVVDCLDEFPPTHGEVEHINEILRKIADGIVKWQDPKSGVWYQVTDQGGRAGNYLEATASAMFVYTLAKGVNHGYLPRDKYLPAIEKGYAGIVNEFLRFDEKGRVDLINCVEVSGLGFTNRDGRPRDGSYDYYLSEPIVKNDLKGVGPFIHLGLEMEKFRAQSASGKKTAGPTDAATIVASIEEPRIPAGGVSITDLGAKAGDDISQVLRTAIAQVSAKGGGRVHIPAGKWISGPIHLLSRVELNVAEGATVLFKTDPAAYLPAVFTRWEGMECYNYSALIYAIDQTDIAVTGKGILDGGASDKNWWAWKRTSRQDRDKLYAWSEAGLPVEERRMGDQSLLRPNFVQLYRCERVKIEGVTFLRSPMWILHPVLCHQVIVRGVSIISHGPNSDGCNPESSRNVLIEDSLFDTGDDCIAIKSGRNNDGRRLNVPSENIVIRRCVMKDGHGGVVIGSEISGGARNIFGENLVMDSANLDRALRIKSNASRGGLIENVNLRDTQVGKVSEAVLTIDLQYEEGAKGDHIPVVRNINLERITATASPRVMWIAGIPQGTIDRIRFKDSTISGLQAPDLVEFASRIQLENVKVLPEKRSRGLNSVAPPAP